MTLSPAPASTTVSGGNVVFQVWEPGTGARINADGTLALDGQPMHDASPAEEPAAWIGALPRSGP